MQPENYFFVCGAGHSGTTLMLAILDSHSEITAIPRETGIFKRIPSDKELYQAVAEWPDRFGCNGKYIIEKTPYHAKFLDRILTLFPEARVVFMVRDGRDATVSATKRVGDFNEALRDWVVTHQKAMPFLEDHRVKVVNYEALVTDHDAVVRDVCKFLGIEFEEDMLTHHQQERLWWDKEIKQADFSEPLVGKNHKRNRNWQINQPIFNGSGRWRTEMSPDQMQEFDRLGGSINERFGYK